MLISTGRQIFSYLMDVIAESQERAIEKLSNFFQVLKSAQAQEGLWYGDDEDFDDDSTEQHFNAMWEVLHKLRDKKPTWNKEFFQLIRDSVEDKENIQHIRDPWAFCYSYIQKRAGIGGVAKYLEDALNYIKDKWEELILGAVAGERPFEPKAIFRGMDRLDPNKDLMKKDMDFEFKVERQDLENPYIYTVTLVKGTSDKDGKPFQYTVDASDNNIDMRVGQSFTAKVTSSGMKGTRIEIEGAKKDLGPIPTIQTHDVFRVLTKGLKRFLESGEKSGILQEEDKIKGMIAREEKKIKKIDRIIDELETKSEESEGAEKDKIEDEIDALNKKRKKILGLISSIRSWEAGGLSESLKRQYEMEPEGPVFETEVTKKYRKYDPVKEIKQVRFEPGLGGHKRTPYKTNLPYEGEPTEEDLVVLKTKLIKDADGTEPATGIAYKTILDFAFDAMTAKNPEQWKAKFIDKLNAFLVWGGKKELKPGQTTQKITDNVQGELVRIMQGNKDLKGLISGLIRAVGKKKIHQSLKSAFKLMPGRPGEKEYEKGRKEIDFAAELMTPQKLKSIRDNIEYYDFMVNYEKDMLDALRQFVQSDRIVLRARPIVHIFVEDPDYQPFLAKVMGIVMEWLSKKSVQELRDSLDHLAFFMKELANEPGYSTFIKDLEALMGKHFSTISDVDSLLKDLKYLQGVAGKYRKYQGALSVARQGVLDNILKLIDGSKFKSAMRAFSAYEDMTSLGNETAKVKSLRMTVLDRLKEVGYEQPAKGKAESHTFEEIEEKVSKFWENPDVRSASWVFGQVVEMDMSPEDFSQYVWYDTLEGFKKLMETSPKKALDILIRLSGILERESKNRYWREVEDLKSIYLRYVEKNIGSDEALDLFNDYINYYAPQDEPANIISLRGDIRKLLLNKLGLEALRSKKSYDDLDDF